MIIPIWLQFTFLNLAELVKAEQSNVQILIPVWILTLNTLVAVIKVISLHSTDEIFRKSVGVVETGSELHCSKT